MKIRFFVMALSAIAASSCQGLAPQGDASATGSIATGDGRGPVMAALPAAASLTSIPSGEGLYKERCAVCHDASDATKAPDLAALRRMPTDHVRFTLTDGVMAQQAEGLTAPELQSLVAYVAAPPAPAASRAGSTWIDALRCSADSRAVDMSGPRTLTSYGVEPSSHRQMSAERSGLTTGQMADLEVAWALPFPEATNLRSQGVIVGETLFYAAPQAGTVLALDVDTGCVKWDFKAPNPLRTSLTFGEIRADGTEALIFGDARGVVRALAPDTGALIWAVDPRHDRSAPLTGAPTLYDRKVIVPVSAADVGRAADPNYQCCTSHGAVVMLDASDGSVLWTRPTTDDARPLGRNNGRGVELLGPSGAPVWSTPSIDVERQLVYATTGQNTSPPATATSDAVLALDMHTGEVRWSFQGLARDIWNLACTAAPPSGPNCMFEEGESVLKDYDFGASVIVARTSEGRGILLAGQKSGDLWALDPDNKGALLWNRRFGEGTALGGIHWGIASDGRRVFVPINDPSYPGRPGESGLYAVDIDTGDILWSWAAAADCGAGRGEQVLNCETKYGLSAAPMVVDQSILTGSLDGKLRIFDAATGAVIFEYDTIRTFDGLGGLTGRGGAIDSHSIFAGAGMVFVGSGYGSFNQQPGNVLIAFRPKAAARSAIAQ